MFGKGKKKNKIGFGSKKKNPGLNYKKVNKKSSYRNSSFSNEREKSKENYLKERRIREVSNKYKIRPKRNKPLFSRFSMIELIEWMLLSVSTFFIFEAISRLNPWGGVDFISENPSAAIVNMLLFGVFFSISFVLKRKVASKFLIFILMVVFSISNAIVLFHRGMPIGFSDLFSFREALSIMTIFVDQKTIIMVCSGIIIALGIFVFLFVKFKSRKRIKGWLNVIIALGVIIGLSIYVPQAKKDGALTRIAWNTAMSYEKNGTLFSFVDSYIGYIRIPPKGYNQKNIAEIRSEVDQKEKSDKRIIAAKKDYPNIIFVQLEGFMDPTRIHGVEFSKDPMPNFRELMKNYTSGYANVPVTGGGTARTEYEVLSGANFDYLVDGEIPYLTFLANKTSPTVATNYRNLGLYTTGEHNFEGYFYNRAKGYKNMGFERFVSKEYMYNLEYNEMGWPKDMILADTIPQAIKRTKDKRDFIMAVSVQGHSKYPTNPLDREYPIKVTGNVGQANINQIEYYTEQVREMDQFVGELVDEISKLNEKTIIVFYGDHQPALDIIKKRRDKMDVYSTVFTCYSNFKTPKYNVPKDMQSYQFSQMINYLAGMKYSPMEKIHAYLKDDKDYQKKLALVQYDILFGKRYFLKPGEGQGPNDIEFGFDKVKISKIYADMHRRKLVIKGDNFTGSSQIEVNGKMIDTKLIDEHTIETNLINIDDENEIRVCQVSRGYSMTSTPIYKFVK